MRTSVLMAVAAASLSLLLATPGAEARSRHERVQIAPLKEKGKVVGVKLSLTLRPEDYGHDAVRIGLGPKGGSPTGDHRELASNPAKKFLYYQWKEIKNLKTGTPKPITLEVRYKDAPNLKPGSEVEVISAWRQGNASYFHVWGMKSGISGAVDTYKLPRATTARVAADKGKDKGKDKATASRTTRGKGTAAARTTRGKGTAAARTTRGKGTGAAASRSRTQTTRASLTRASSARRATTTASGRTRASASPRARAASSTARPRRATAPARARR